MGQQARNASWMPGKPPPSAVHVEQVIDPFTQGKVVGMLRHAGHAFVVDAPAGMGDADWADVGSCYLQAMADVLGFRPGHDGWLHPAVWDALITGGRRPLGTRVGEGLGFGWLPVTWDGPLMGELPVGKRPLGSFWVDRSSQAPETQRTLVLLAGNVEPEHGIQFGSDMGLRIAMHWADGQARIHGATFAGLSGDLVHRALPRTTTSSAQLYDLVRTLRRPIANALRLNHGWVWLGNVQSALSPSPNGQDLLAVSGTALRWRQRPAQGGKGSAGSEADRTKRSALVYDFAVDIDRQSLAVVNIRRMVYVGSQAWPVGRVFLRDPASQGQAADMRSRRPTRTQGQLDHFRAHMSVAVGPDATLRFGDPHPWFESKGASGLQAQQASRAASANGSMTLDDQGVVQARQVLRPAHPLPGAPTDAPTGNPTGNPTDASIYADEQASVETHVRAAELFARLSAFGFDPHAYFRFARLPLVQRVRPSMRWAPDGELKNAEVRPYFEDRGNGAPQISQRMQLLVRYGSDNPLHRRKLPRQGGRPGVKAQYLSVASDARWAWHEFGHVLNFASTGELEFPFAHSAGDALAAITADPLSGLAPNGQPEAPERFASFPWIAIPGRNHGRSALRGYCWCGRRNRVRLDFSATLAHYHHSYFGEQLLSSSLFRLYRSLGGDTRGGVDPHADQAMRLEASDYTVYLIMFAISLLGPDTLAPARTADQFVSALIDADLGTAAWRVNARWPFDQKTSPRVVSRQGGRVHKLIRWAFEQQGLYATDDPEAVAEGLGQPPAVDIFLADRRLAGSGQTPDGGYHPVPLRWSDEAQPWHASESSVARVDSQVVVTVFSRHTGALPDDLAVKGWWAAANASDKLAWRPLAPTRPTESGVSDREPFMLDLPPEASTLASGLWLLVSADTAADPSHLGHGQEPPSASSELLELVAHDNNLALARR